MNHNDVLLSLNQSNFIHKLKGHGQECPLGFLAIFESAQK